MNIVNGKEVAELHRYGCHNKPRPAYGDPVYHSQGRVSWPHRFSVGCKYDRMEKDGRCEGCNQVGVGE